MHVNSSLVWIYVNSSLVWIYGKNALWIRAANLSNSKAAQWWKSIDWLKWNVYHSKKLCVWKVWMWPHWLVWDRSDHQHISVIFSTSTQCHLYFCAQFVLGKMVFEESCNWIGLRNNNYPHDLGNCLITVMFRESAWETKYVWPSD